LGLPQGGRIGDAAESRGGLSIFKKAFCACLEGKKYIAKY
jgi:hypothetical protein